MCVTRCGNRRACLSVRARNDSLWVCGAASAAAERTLVWTGLGVPADEPLVLALVLRAALAGNTFMLSVATREEQMSLFSETVKVSPGSA